MLPPLRLLRHRTLSLDNLYISITIYYENINVKEYLLWTLNLLKLSKTRPPQPSLRSTPHQQLIDDHTLLIPSAGMHSIEADFATDNHITIAVGSYKVPGTTGTGCGFHIHGTGKFETSGAYFDQMHTKFDWIRATLVVTIDDVEQKI